MRIRNGSATVENVNPDFQDTRSRGFRNIQRQAQTCSRPLGTHCISSPQVCSFSMLLDSTHIYLDYVYGRIEDYYSKRCGVLTGDVEVLLHVRPFKVRFLFGLDD